MRPATGSDLTERLARARAEWTYRYYSGRRYADAMGNLERAEWLVRYLKKRRTAEQWIKYPYLRLPYVRRPFAVITGGKGAAPAP